MKNTFLFLLTFLTVSVIISSCGVNKQIQSENKLEIANSKDSTEYELIIFDPNFDTWLLTQPTSINNYSNEYLRSKNFTYVMSWNNRYTKGDHRFSTYIDYDLTVDYGLELNYRLFMYFKYFEQTNRVNLLRLL